MMNQITQPTIPMKIPLHDYQQYAKNFILTHPFSGLFLKMGLGKTSIVLEALWELNPSSHVLIIAPKTIARVTWINEIHKWGIDFRTKSLVVNDRGKQLDKKHRDIIFNEIPNEPPTVYFINRELIPTLVKRFPDNKWPFQIVIIDESQSFKSHSAERFKALKKVRPWISRLHELTGSPTPKGLEDLWAQIYLLDMGARLGQNITRYRDEFFNPGLIVNGYPVTYRPKYGAEREIYRRIADLVISMKNDRIKLPPLTFDPIYIDMDPDEAELYKQFVKTSVLELGEGVEIEAKNAAVLSAKLSQMASGSIYTNGKTHEYVEIHHHKLEVCEYIINNTPSNVVIAYHFQSDLDMLRRYLTDVGLTPTLFDGSPEMELAWNQKQIPILLLQPASCGRGLNLQDGGYTLIWYTLPWSLEEYEQTNARIYRQGQTEPTVIHQLMMRNTIDPKILRSLNAKDMSQDKLIEAVKVTIDEAKDNTN